MDINIRVSYARVRDWKLVDACGSSAEVKKKIAALFLERTGHHVIFNNQDSPVVCLDLNDINVMHKIQDEIYMNAGVDLIEAVDFQGISNAEYKSAEYFFVLYIDKNTSDTMEDACRKSRRKEAKKIKFGIYQDSGPVKKSSDVMYCNDETRKRMEKIGLTGINFNVCQHCGGECGLSRLIIDEFDLIPSRLIPDGFSLYNLRHNWGKDFQIVSPYSGDCSLILSRRAIEFCAEYGGNTPAQIISAILNPDYHEVFPYSAGIPCLPGDHADVIGIAPAEVVDKIGYPKYSTWPLRKHLWKP